MFEGGSKWSAPLYACASAVKANIKTVSFRVNGSIPSLNSLSVTDVRDKEYPDNNSMPLWGVEDSGLALDGISPVWGLISPEYLSFPNISVVRKPSLYLIGSSDFHDFAALTLRFGNLFENMPGSDFAPWAMNSVYSGNSIFTKGLLDYSGSSNLAMFVKWSNLSRTPEHAASIINLIWTDIAAQSVVGTKGVLGSNNAGLPNETVSITVYPIVHEIKYNYLFGIPAFILAANLLVISLLALISAATKRSSLTILRRRLCQLSTGRIFLTFQYPELSSLETPSKQWSRTMGQTEVDLNNVGHDLRGPNEINGGEHAAVVENVQSTSQSPSTGTVDHRNNPSEALETLDLPTEL